MQTDKIQINHKHYKVEEIQHLLLNTELPKWERSIYEFIGNWFDDSDYILQKTSGSTGKPKEIKLKKTAMKASALATIDYFNLKENHTAWLCLPIEYIAGKMMVVRTIIGNLNLIITEPSGTPQVPVFPIDFTAMVPLQLKKIMESKTDLSSIRTLIIGGAAVDYSLLQEIKPLSTQIFATYGMTETCSHIALQRLSGKNTEPYFSLLPDVSISQNTNGCLEIVAPKLLDKKIVSTDLVEIISPNQFRILGRSDNVINSGGIKISPELLETEISEIIGETCVLLPQADKLLGEKLVLVLQKKEDNELFENVLEKIKNKVGKHRTPKVVYYLEQFPFNQSMKIDRKKIKEILSINL